jgi:hypothetical protein
MFGWFFGMIAGILGFHMISIDFTSESGLLPQVIQLNRVKVLAAAMVFFPWGRSQFAASTAASLLDNLEGLFQASVLPWWINLPLASKSSFLSTFLGFNIHVAWPKNVGIPQVWATCSMEKWCLNHQTRWCSHNVSHISSDWSCHFASHEISPLYLPYLHSGWFSTPLQLPFRQIQGSIVNPYSCYHKENDVTPLSPSCLAPCMPTRATRRNCLCIVQCLENESGDIFSSLQNPGKHDMLRVLREAIKPIFKLG